MTDKKGQINPEDTIDLLQSCTKQQMDKVSTLQVNVVEHLTAKELHVNPQVKAETKTEQKHSEHCHVDRGMTPNQRLTGSDFSVFAKNS